MTISTSKSSTTTPRTTLDANHATRTPHPSEQRSEDARTSTHPCITISWKFQPPSYLAVATVVEGAARPVRRPVRAGRVVRFVAVLGGGSAW